MSSTRRWAGADTPTVYRAHTAASPESRRGAEGAGRPPSRRRPNRPTAKGIRVRAPTRPSTHRHRLRTRPRLADHGAGRGRDGERVDNDGPAARCAGTDRRRTGLRPSPRNRALRRQAVEHPCFAGLFPRSVDRLRRRAHGRRNRLASHGDTLEASLPYTAPELLRGRPPSALTDAYALACTAVELLIGAPPFSGDTSMELMDAHLSWPVPGYSTQDRLGATGFSTRAAQGVGEDPGKPLRLVHGVRRALSRVLWSSG